MTLTFTVPAGPPVTVALFRPKIPSLAFSVLFGLAPNGLTPDALSLAAAAAARDAKRDPDQLDNVASEQRMPAG